MCQIRKIQKSDINGFHAALSKVAAERKYLLTVEPPLLEDVKQFISNNIDNDYAQYIADANAEVVGWADIIPHQKEVMRHSGLLGMGVIAEYRGRGIGRELLHCAIEHAWAAGLTRLELEVFADNTRAIALYQKFGFELEGVKRNARLLEGVYKDVHVMAQCRL